MIPRIKICCIQNVKEARIAVDASASAIGLISEMPSGPGVIAEETIRAVADWTPPGITSVLLTSLQDPEQIISQHGRCRTGAIQLVDKQTPETHKILKERLPGIQIIQVIHMTDDSAVIAAQEMEDYADALLLDSGDPGGETKVLGGTGRIHNWEISREIVQKVDKPVFLAGGLTPMNVTEATKKVRPFGIDVCSGVRTDGQLDGRKVRDFVRQVQKFGETEFID